MKEYNRGEKAFILLPLLNTKVVKDVEILSCPVNYEEPDNLSGPNVCYLVSYNLGTGDTTDWVYARDIYPTYEEAAFVLSLQGQGLKFIKTW